MKAGSLTCLNAVTSESVKPTFVKEKLDNNDNNAKIHGQRLPTIIYNDEWDKNKIIQNYVFLCYN